MGKEESLEFPEPTDVFRAKAVVVQLGDTLESPGGFWHF